MADIPKILGQASPAAATPTTLYTAPGGATTVISSVSICNRNAVGVTFRLSIAAGAAADDPKQYLYYDLPLAAKDTFVATIGITVGQTDAVRCYADTTDVAFSLFGIEASPDVSDGWRSTTQEWAYASATSFTISGDWTTLYNKGDKIKLTQTTTKYFYVTGVSFGGGNTTVTINGGSDYTLANAAIAAPLYSKELTPAGFPTWFNYVPTLVGWSATPSITAARFMLLGSSCRFSITTGTGTANAGSKTVSLPVTAATVAGHTWSGSTGTVNTGNGGTTPGRIQISSAAVVANLYLNWDNVNLASSGSTYVYEMDVSYEI
jgi:hypothetical protein